MYDYDWDSVLCDDLDCEFCSPQKKEGKNPMKKQWYTCGNIYDTYDEAEVAAKKRSARNNEDVAIYEKIALAKAVVPAIEVVKVQ